jgi:hypothetical protein
LVPVFVPRALLSDVYEHIAKLSRAMEPALLGTDSPGQAQTDADPAVSDKLLRRMYDESEPPHRRLIEFFAENPDRWMYTSEIASDLDLPHGNMSLAGMLGAFGRRAKHRYEGKTPWRSEWDPARGEVRHMMPQAIADLVGSL